MTPDACVHAADLKRILQYIEEINEHVKYQNYGHAKTELISLELFVRRVSFDLSKSSKD